MSDMPGTASATHRQAPARQIRLDATRSPAPALPPGMVRVDRRVPAGTGPWSHDADSYDAAMLLLTASDNAVSDRLATALLEVKEGRLYQREGHARWSTYLRAYVGPTARWCQQEMRRVRQLRQYPLLSEAWSKAAISKSHLRVLLRVVTPDTQVKWLEAARATKVRVLDRMAREELVRRRQEQAAGGAVCAADAAGEDPDEPGGRRRCRTVMAPACVAAKVAEAVDVARKVEGYHIGAGAAVSLMAAETMTALSRWPDVTAGGAPMEGQAGSGSNDAPGAGWGTPPEATSLLGDEQELRREVGRFWEAVQEQYEQAEAWRRRAARLGDDLPEVILDGAPAEDADAHQRVVFWSAVQGRVDALRGRLLRFMQESSRLEDLRFAGAGHYARERLGLTAREAAELIRLDRALEELPVAYRMYAAGSLGRRKAWLVSLVATARTDRAWTRFAVTHTLRLLEALVERHELIERTDSRQFGANGGMPPQDATFAETTRACSLLKGAESIETSVPVRLVLDRQQESLLEQAMTALRDEHGAGRPDWWCLGAMAGHFLDTYAELDRQAVPDRLRRMLHRKVIERDNYTCSAPECLQRGGLETDHVLMRSRGGPDEEWNLQSLCAAEHRYSKHRAGTLAMHGRAPGELTIKMGSRVYRNDRLVKPAFDEAALDEDPWAVREAGAPRPTSSCSSVNLPSPPIAAPAATGGHAAPAGCGRSR